MQDEARFPSNPLKIRVLFFLPFSFNKETLNKKGKRVLQGYLGRSQWHSSALELWLGREFLHLLRRGGPKGWNGCSLHLDLQNTHDKHQGLAFRV